MRYRTLTLAVRSKKNYVVRMTQLERASENVIYQTAVPRPILPRILKLHLGEIIAR